MNTQDIPIRDLHLPGEPGFWPLAPGWWALLVIAVVLVATLLVAAIRRMRRNRARKFALRQLRQARVEYDTHGNPVLLATTVSDILRRTMLAYAPRHEVAGLSGDDWAAWLDRGLPEPLFSTGAGAALLSLPYRNPRGDHGSVDVDALCDAAAARIRTPLEARA